MGSKPSNLNSVLVNSTPHLYYLDPHPKIGIAIHQEPATTTDMTSTKSQTSFRARVEQYSARHIANAIGCSLPTAYDWRSGRRAPPAWLQAQILTELANYHPQVKHNETTT